MTLTDNLQDFKIEYVLKLTSACAKRRTIFLKNVKIKRFWRRLAQSKGNDLETPRIASEIVHIYKVNKTAEKSIDKIRYK